MSGRQGALAEPDTDQGSERRLGAGPSRLFPGWAGNGALPLAAGHQLSGGPRACPQW